MRGLTQISLWFWSELLPLPGGGALLATVGLAPRTSQGSPKRVMRKACALSTAQPLASLPGYFYFFPPPPPRRAEAQRGRFSARASETCCRSRTLAWVTSSRGQWVWLCDSSFQAKELLLCSHQEVPTWQPCFVTPNLSLSNAWRSIFLAGHVKGQMIHH